ncbi:MAG: response regulator [Pseudomonadota bacterium]
MNDNLQTILYVEDDESIAEITLLSLKEFGKFHVYHFSSGREALEALPLVKPQLVLLDVMMPFMDGIETLKFIRQMQEGKDLPVIFMTARAQTHEQQRYLDLGAEAVIVKPFDPLNLSDRLNDMWDTIRAA